MKFQTSSWPLREMPPAYNPDNYNEGSYWKPALRRIRRGLFSSRETPEYSDCRQPLVDYVLPPLPFDELSQQSLRKVPSPENPREPREPQISSGFSFVKQTLSNTGEEERKGTELARPNSVVYLQTGATPDSFTGTERRKPLEGQSTGQRAVAAAFVPKHAAIDFSRLNVNPIVDRNNVLDNRIRRKALPPSYPVTVRPTKFETENECTDYQNFLAESRAAEVRAYNSFYSPNETTPQTSQIMDETTANHQRAGRERVISMSKRSTTSRLMSMSGGFFEKVAEYWKPSDLDSEPKQEITSFTAGDRSTLIGSTYSQERQENRWSRVSGSIRRSFTRDRDRQEDKRGRRTSWLSEGTSGKRKIRVVPMVPALRKYNRAVQEGMY